MPKHFDPNPGFTVTAWEADVISESTSAAGVTVDGVLLKDGEVTTDTINEESSGAGVTVDSVPDEGRRRGHCRRRCDRLKSMLINEATAAAGVTIETVLLKDGDSLRLTRSTNSAVVTASRLTAY